MPALYEVTGFVRVMPVVYNLTGELIYAVALNNTVIGLDGELNPTSLVNLLSKDKKYRLSVEEIPE